MPAIGPLADAALALPNLRFRGVKQTPVRHDVCLLITQRAKGYL